MKPNQLVLEVAGDKIVSAYITGKMACKLDVVIVQHGKQPDETPPVKETPPPVTPPPKKDKP